MMEKNKSAEDRTKSVEDRTLIIYNAVLKDIIYPILGKKTTWSKDITKMGHKLFGMNYAGTFPADMIPDIGKNRDGSIITDGNIKKDSPLYTILNLDRSSEPGSHWIAVGYDIDSGMVWVYDSFGRDTKAIAPLLVQKFGDKLRMADDDAEQMMHEEDCGARCLAFLYIMDRMGVKYAKLI